MTPVERLAKVNREYVSVCACNKTQCYIIIRLLYTYEYVCIVVCKYIRIYMYMLISLH